MTINAERIFPGKRLVKTSVREAVGDGGPEWNIECWFSNGEKYAPIIVDFEDEELADLMSFLLNKAIEENRSG